MAGYRSHSTTKKKAAPDAKRPAGRPKGAVNQRTREFCELYDQKVRKHKKDPLDVLFSLMKNPDPAIQLQAAKELMSYRYSKMRTITLDDGEGGNPLQVLADAMSRAVDGGPS